MLIMKRCFVRTQRLAVLTIFLVFAVAAFAQELVIVPDGQGVYRPGETIGWNLETKGFTATEAEFVLKKGGLSPMTTGRVPLVDGKGRITAQLEQPGWLLVEVAAASPEQKKFKGLGGALVAPEGIQPALPCPEDFGAFWKAKLKELADVAPNVELTEIDCGKTNLQYFRICMDNIRGSHIRGQLARPRHEGKLPAMLIVQWAGVYPLQKSWVVDRAAEGWLTLNINAHDRPIDEPDRFRDAVSTARP